MSTPHIDAPPGAFAKLVLLPGDPLRARHIAKTLLARAVEVTSVRNMLGFTGEWKGMPVSVMGSGIGIPSSMLYATELIRDHGVHYVVRVGTCGAIAGDVRLGDLVLALGASTDSSVNRLRFGGFDFAATASWPLLSRVATMALQDGPAIRVGRVFTSDFFYHPRQDLLDLLQRFGFLALDMETAGLYGIAAEFGAEALSVMTVSDHLADDTHMDAEQRETGVDRMIRLVLDSLLP
ncbi:MAG TPA: purine-nucleoside phosphorylase [Steroidobacteraceae bacterium]|nr:purine-nucleoside phosphorylase [Steroidobacteraceae bacterium]